VRKNSFIIFSCFLIALIVFSCKKKEPDNNTVVDISLLKGSTVLVINEGNYTNSNASITYFNSSNSAVTDDIFKTVNSRPLGDVIQSVLLTDEKFYLVVNNSQKIEIVGASDFKSLSSIKNLTSPRYILPVGNSKAYITDIYSNSIWVVSLTDNSIIKQIPCKGSTEEMLLFSGKVYITNTRKEFLYIADASSDQITDSIHIGYGSNSMRIDKNNNIWIMCAGSIDNSINAGIYKIDPLTNSVVLSLPLPTPLNIWDRIEISKNSDTIYFMCSGIYKMSIDDISLPSDPFIAQSGKLFHGLGIDPSNGIIYIADAIDYVQKGKVYRYRPDGNLIDSFNAGIIPSDFCFY
jgi:hypothetical protein